MEENRNVTEELEKIQEPQAKTQLENKEETPEQINWRKFRETREQERKAAERRIAEERERAEKASAEAKALKEAIDAIISRDSGSGSESDTGDGRESDRDDSERIAKLVRDTIAKQEQERERERAEREKKEWPQKIIRDLPDFDKVCTTENLDYLEFHHPEIAAPFKELPDGYNKWKNIYSVIKKMIPNAISSKDERRMEKNLAKPRSISSPGLPTGGEGAPYFMDDARKRSNWQRMQKVMKGI